MSFSMNDLGLTFSAIFGNSPFVLKGVSDWKDFETGTKQGYKYDIADTERCLRFSVKHAAMTPIITNEEVRKSTNPILVSIAADKVTFYGNNLRSCDISVIADSISITKLVTMPKGFSNVDPTLAPKT